MLSLTGSGGQEINLLSLASMDVDESALPLPTLTLTLQSGALVVLRYEPSRGAPLLLPRSSELAHSDGSHEVWRLEDEPNQAAWFGSRATWNSLSGSTSGNLLVCARPDFGLRVFANQNSYRSGSDPTLFVQTAAIGKVLRATGRSWYEFGLQGYVFPPRSCWRLALRTR